VADAITVEAVNGPAFAAALEDAKKAATEPKEALAALARVLVPAAQAAAPKRTGRLAGSHKAEAAEPSKVRVVTDTPYAAVIHWGWPGHGIRAQKWLVATWLRDPGPLDAATTKIQAGLDQASAKT